MKQLIRIDLNLQIFLSYFSKDEVHEHNVKKVPCVPIRDKSIFHMLEINKPLIVTVDGEDKDAMILYPDTVMSLMLSQSTPQTDKFGGKKYTIMRFEWKPLDEDTLNKINELYTTIEDMKDGLKD